MKYLAWIFPLVCVACSPDASEKTTMPAPNQPVVASVPAKQPAPVAPAPKPLTPEQIQAEAQSLAQLLVMFEQETKQRAPALQNGMRWDKDGSQAAHLMLGEAQEIAKQIQRLQQLSLQAASTRAIRDKLVRAWQEDVRLAEQTAQFFADANASAPAEPTFDADALQREAEDELLALLKPVSASAPASASAP